MAMLRYYKRFIFNELPNLASVLSKNIFGAAGLYFQFLAYLVFGKIRGQYKKDFNLFFKNRSFSLKLSGGSPDLAALIETFVKNEYDIKNLINPNIILDIGAHTGNTSIYFSILFPEATIHAIEASPDNYLKLMENVKSFPKVVPHNVAVSDSEGVVDFYENKSSLGSSLQRRSENDGLVRVKSVTLKSFFSEHKIQRVDLMKVDIEGGEALLFKDNLPEEFSDRYVIEIHEDLMSISSSDLESKFGGYDLNRQDIVQKSRYILEADIKL